MVWIVKFVGFMVFRQVNLIVLWNLWCLAWLNCGFFGVWVGSFSRSCGLFVCEICVVIPCENLPNGVKTLII